MAGNTRTSGSASIEQTRILLNRQEAAWILNVCTKTLDNLVLANRIRPRRIGGRVLFIRGEIEAFAHRAYQVALPKRTKKQATVSLDPAQARKDDLWTTSLDDENG